MDILIKSFNRPYYLDRAIYSLKKYLVGNYTITILDDGTPQKYLDKILNKYPDVILKRNEKADLKSKAIENNIKEGTEINGFIIPTDLWKGAVEKASEYFVMTEDDVWLTEEIDLMEVEKTLKFHEVSLLKVGWISNRKVNAFLRDTINEEIVALEPNFWVAGRWFMHAVIKNKYRLFSLLYRLKLVDKNTYNDYWIMNSLLMGIYKKEYWLFLWDKIEGRVDEQMQIINATQWYRKNKRNKFNYTKFKNLKMSTTFVSSATNSYHQYGIDCDINFFNYIMNEEWYSGNFNSLQNFPKDISEDYYMSFLSKHNNNRCLPENWKAWADKFKEQYRRQDVVVD